MGWRDWLRGRGGEREAPLGREASAASGEAPTLEPDHKDETVDELNQARQDRSGDVGTVRAERDPPRSV